MASFNFGWLYGVARNMSKAARGKLFFVALALACFACGTKSDAPAAVASGGAHADAGTVTAGGQSHSAQGSGGNDGADSASGTSSPPSSVGGSSSVPPRSEAFAKPADLPFKKPVSDEAAVRTFLASHPRIAAAPHAPSPAPQFAPNQAKDLSTCSSVTLTSDHPLSTFDVTGQYAVKGQTLVWTAATSCASPQYQFNLRNTDNVWTTVQPWSTAATFTWDTSALPTGYWEVQVLARNGTSGSEQSSTITEVMLNDQAACTALTVTSDHSPVYPPYAVKGDIVHWTATSTCPGPAQYQFQLLAPGASSYVMVQDWSSSPTFNWNTAGVAIGQWWLIVVVRDVPFAEPGYSQVYAPAEMLVNDYAACTSATVTADDADYYAVPGQQVHWTAVADCAGPAEYRFVFDDPTGVWSEAQAWSSKNTYTWDTTNQPLGYWGLQVWVRDAPFYDYEQAYAWNAFILNSSQPCLAISSTPSARTIAAGTPVTVQSTVQQCTTSEFEVWHQPPGGAWARDSAYSPANANYTWDTTGVPVGLHTFQVRTRTQGSPQEYQTYASFYVDVLAGNDIPTSAPLIQDFNALGPGALDTLPANWLIDKQSSPRTVGTFGAARTQTELAAGASLAANAANGIYNFGAGVADPQSPTYWLNSTDRAPGWLADGADLTTGGTKSGNLYVALRAPADKDLQSLEVGYDLEQYRKGVNPLPFHVQLFSSPDGTTWTNAGNQFVSAFGSDVAYADTNPAPGNSTTVHPTTLPANISRGKPFYLAWNYTVDSPTSNNEQDAQALGIDNVSIKGSSECVPNCAAKHCGDSLDDGCGHACAAQCGSGAVGCHATADCQTGLACSGMSVGASAPDTCQPLAPPDVHCAGATITATPATSAPVGAPVSFTVTSNCGGYAAEYAFYYANTTQTAQNILFRDWSSLPTASWDTSALASGNYTIFALARTVGGTGFDAEGGLGFLVGSVCNQATLSIAPPSPYPTDGTPIAGPGAHPVLTATATCNASGVVPEYQFFHVPPAETATYQQMGCQDGSASCPNEWLSSNTFNVDTSNFANGTHGFYVQVRAHGNSSNVEGSAYAPKGYLFGSVCGSVTPILTSPTSPALSGTTVGLTAIASCTAGTEAAYHFYYRNYYTEYTWHDVVPGFSTSPSVNWDTSGLPAGTYQVEVVARGSGNQSSAESYSVANFVLESPTSPSYCQDGVLDADESGVDCGGSCSPCAACQPKCAGKDYGDDGCGGSCGVCSFFQYEGPNGHCLNSLSVLKSTFPTTIPTSEYVTEPSGAIDGSPSVSDTGQFRYSVPLVLPPGRAGMSPFLGLAYDSSGGNGELGQGWSLTGISQISSCPETISQDGRVRGLRDAGTVDGSTHSTDSEALCLDGARLIRLPGTTTSGQSEYRTEVDSGMKVVTVDRNDLSKGFRVYSSDGRISTFTQLSTDVVTDTGEPGSGTNWVQLPIYTGIWSVTRIEDRTGNYLTVDYDISKAYPIFPRQWGVKLLPKTIWYAGAADGTEPDTRVELEYEERSDIFERYRAGMLFRHDQLLKAIHITVGDLQVRTYHLSYTPRTEDLLLNTKGTNRLTRLTECVPDLQGSSTEICKPATTFDYDGYSNGRLLDWTGFARGVPIGYHPNNPGSAQYDVIPDLPLDMNGDGVDDLLMVVLDGAPGSEDWNGAYKHFEVLMDGRDLIKGAISGATGVQFPVSTNAWINAPEVYNVIDYDADGRDDLLMEGAIEVGNYKVLTYKNAALQVVDLGIPSSTPPGPSGATPIHRSYVVDADGDGVRDIVKCTGALQHKGQSQDYGPWTWTYIHLPDLTERPIDFNGFCFAHYITADLTGSGRQSLLMQDYRHPSVLSPDQDIEDIKQYIAISFDGAESQNTGTVGTTVVKTPVQVSAHDSLSALPLDANGDGLLDLLSYYPSGALVTCLGTGVGANPFKCGGPSGYLEGYAKTNAAGDGVLLTAAGAAYVLGPVLDVNGDGRDDVLIATPGETAWRVLESIVVGASNPLSGRYASGWHIGAPAELQAPVTTWNGHVLTGRGLAMDVNGDGIKDFVQKPTGGFGPANLVAYLREGSSAPRITSVRNGMGNTTGVTYANASNPESRPAASDPLSEYFTPNVYTSDTKTCAYTDGVLCAPPRQALVIEHQQSASGVTSGRRTFEHQYSGQRFGINGRGFLGFSAHMIREPDHGAFDVSQFDNVTRDSTTGLFPFAGRQASHVDLTAFGGDLLGAIGHEKLTQLDFHRNATSGAVIIPFAHVTTETTQISGTNDDTTATVTHTVEIDEYGNQKSVVSAWNDGGRVEQEKLTTTFAHETESQFLDAWLVHLPSKRIVSSSGITGESTQHGFARTTTFSYYDSGLLKDTTVEPDAEAGKYTVSTHFERNAYGNVWQAQTCSGKPPCAGADTRTTSVDYDDARHVFPVSTTDAEGYTTESDHDVGLGVTTKTVQHGRAGSKTLVSYQIPDGFGRVRVSIAPDQRTDTTSYSSVDDEIHTYVDWAFTVNKKFDGGPAVRYHYDSLGQETLMGTTGFGGLSSAELVAETVYTDLGEVWLRFRPGPEPHGDIQISDASFTYDNIGRPLASEERGGAKSSNCYSGNTTCVVDAVGNVRCAEKDHRGRTLFAGDPTALGSQACADVAYAFSTTPASQRAGVAYAYGPFSQLETATRMPEGKLIERRGNDRLGRVESEEDIGVSEKAVTYTAFGETDTVSDDNSSISFQYDKLGRQRFRTIDPVATGEPTTTDEWKWRDDFQGRLDFDSVQDGAKTTYDYDALGRPSSATRKIDGDDFTSSVDIWDEHGRPSVIRYPGEAEFRVKNVYDDASGILIEVKAAPTDAQAPQPSYWKLNAVDPYGQAKTETFGNGVVTNRTYHDWTGLPDSITTGVPQQAPVQQVSYTFYDDRNLKTVDDSSTPSRAFTYDPFGRIDTVKEGQQIVSDLNYNSFGSILTNAKGWTYVYDPAAPDSVQNVSDSAGNTSELQYNANGTLKHRSSGALPELNVQYTAFEKPKKVWSANEDASTLYAYDAQQVKVSKRGALGSTSYFGDIYYRELNSSTSDVAHHYLIHNDHGAIAEVIRTVPGGAGTSTTQTLYLHPDYLGSISVVTSDAGALADQRHFALFGEDETSTPPVTQVGYTGHWQQSEYGLIDMRGRFYDPAVGQFLSADPIGGSGLRSDSFNLKAYVGNNPLRFTDPSGFQGCDELSACGGGGAFSFSLGSQTSLEGFQAQGTGSSFNQVAANQSGYSTGSSYASGTGPNASLGLGDKVVIMGLSAGASYGLGAGTSYVLGTGAAWLCVGSGVCAAVVISSVAVVGTGYAIYDLVWDGGAAKIGGAFKNFDTAEDAVTIGTTLGMVGGFASKPLSSVASNLFAGDAAEGAGPLIEATELTGAQANRVIGNAAADELAATLREGGLTVEREVYYQTPFGSRFADLRVSGEGQVRGLVEVKVGNSPYTLGQQAKDSWIQFFYGHTTNVVRYPGFP